MASAVEICNLALAHIGDRATVASIDPPEGSAQAEHCARFYPIARDSLLELHDWGFATRRAQLALLTSDRPEWDYAYGVPADALRILAVIPSDATDDFAEAIVTNGMPVVSSMVGQPFAREIDSTGRSVIYTDQEDAAARYVAFVTDTTKFSPLFVTTLSWHLASMLAGPVIKGDVGAAEAKRCEAMAARWLGLAKTGDSQQRNVQPAHVPSWIGNR